MLSRSYNTPIMLPFILTFLELSFTFLKFFSWKNVHFFVLFYILFIILLCFFFQSWYINHIRVYGKNYNPSISFFHLVKPDIVVSLSNKLSFNVKHFALNFLRFLVFNNIVTIVNLLFFLIFNLFNLNF